MPSPILQKMLDRLFASLTSGPAMNCRPHSSRQRVNLSHLARCQDLAPETLLRQLLGNDRRARIHGKAERPKRELKKPRNAGATNTTPAPGATEPPPSESTPELSDEEKRLQRLWADQQTLFTKLRGIAEDARTYEQDTGVHALSIGFPLLSLPPGALGAARGATFGTRRIVAPIAFLPVTLEVKTGGTLAIDIACKGEGVDLVRPNIALLAWLAQQTGKKTPDLFDDQEAENPWREIHELVAHVAAALHLPIPEILAAQTGPGEALKLSAAPRADDDAEQGAILPAAVIGLFPMANEGLLRDTQEMAGHETHDGPVAGFLQVDVNLTAAPENGDPHAAKRQRTFAEERLVTHADPCQSRAALLARHTAGLVIHGPPGTGKSQTITNIIGDHLARGQRVLMVCDKRTALDVVAHRLEHLGFGPLVALVHDPQRDQRDLYKAIRERLENLAETHTRPAAAREIDKTDKELQTLHEELTAYWKCLMHHEGDAASFHDLMGEWLEIQNASKVDPEKLKDVDLAEGRSHERLVRETLERATTAQFPINPWVQATNVRLADLLTRSMDDLRDKMRACTDAVAQCQTEISSDIPPIDAILLERELQVRTSLATVLQKLAASPFPQILKRWSGADQNDLTAARERFSQAKGPWDIARQNPLEAELLASVGTTLPTVAELNARILKVDGYLAIATKWYAFLKFKEKRAAREVLMPLGMPLAPETAARARKFFVGLRARIIVRDILAGLMKQPADGLPEDSIFNQLIEAHAGATLALWDAYGAPAGAAMLQVVRQALADPPRCAVIASEMHKSANRCSALLKTEQAMNQTGICGTAALRTALARDKKDAVTFVNALAQFLPQLENVVRATEALRTLPAPMAGLIGHMLLDGVPVDEGAATVNKALLAAEISRRLRSVPALQAMDAHRLQSTFDRYRQLELQKRELVRHAALHHWVSRQKERLLASTHSRVSTLGADLRRRLTMRGERALRLRQVIDVGRASEGGDPLFDMCPVWMASPETVAQIFPRIPLFDVVIFDEASQCRLEEALPVLTRGKRVVIAGDPKQLPPTRFFESAVVVTSDDDDTADEQGLFERTQGEVEDLLSAALNLPIEHAHLDVHYRSRNADLIDFSNQQFYHHRLQAIPGHPDNASGFSPLTLYRADGIYEDRQNEKEAEQVCRIVRDLLKRAEPPSIGIACFNLVQRDLIVEKLDALAQEDAEFGARLAAARTRKGAGSFEGLFVKNLENVQGDERDHIIISTTYGRTKDGKFRQNFGPLGKAGGGRRLNVLVTRAREEIHLVTSIPAELYRSLPPVPAGETPGGAWLLYAYLQFAERLAALYETFRHDQQSAAEPRARSSRFSVPLAAAESTTEENAQPALPVPAIPILEPRVIIQPQQRSLPSRFSESLAAQLAAGHRVGSTVHWGNDGFCIDLALAHPLREGTVTIGILCDATRFRNAEDPVEWDLFRTMIHESQGWKLARLWTPQFFRDPDHHISQLLNQMRTHLAQQRPPDTLGVIPNPT